MDQRLLISCWDLGEYSTNGNVNCHIHENQTCDVSGSSLREKNISTSTNLYNLSLLGNPWHAYGTHRHAHWTPIMARIYARIGRFKIHAKGAKCAHTWKATLTGLSHNPIHYISYGYQLHIMLIYICRYSCYG